MRLSPAAELAVRGVLELAARYGRGPVTLDTICAPRKLPKQYLTKIFSMLVRDGIVTPIRGKGGGYMLARAPANISLLQIIEAVEGPMALNFCQQEPAQCDSAGCSLRPVWSELQRLMREKLSSVLVADCIAPHAKPPAGVP
jgi:Rrf2 family protein